MQKHVVLSATGRDRVGVADDLTALLAERDIHIENSRWTAVAGRFSGMVQVCGRSRDVARLQSELDSLCELLGFDVQLAPVGPQRPSSKTPRFLIECFASGPPDMNAFTGVLKRLGVNIDDLETEIGVEPFSSKLTFTMSARVSIPASTSLDTIQDGLRRLERERNLDVAIKPIRSRVRERKIAPTPEI